MKVDRITHSRDMVIRNFPRWRPTAILDSVKPEKAPFDPPTSKTLPRTKHEVDRMTLCRDMAVRNFPKCEVGRSVGRWSSKLHCSHTLLFATLGTYSARGVKKITTSQLAWWRYGVVVNALVVINEVTLRRARLILEWVTICGRVNHLGM